MLKQLESQIKEVTNKTFTLETGSQSFNKYPTNHIEVCFDDCFVSVEIGTIIYSNVNVYQEVLSKLPELVNACFECSESISDYVMINVCDDKTYNVTFGGLELEQETFNTDSLSDLIDIINNFTFEE